jgi:hypothetical protein
MQTTLARMSTTYGISRRILGVRVVPLIAAYLWANIRLIGAVGMALDTVFYPRLRHQQVKAPIVLVGNPRTGTTFLQRFLCDEGYGAGLEVYRMLYPSILVQKILRPFLPALEAVSPARWHRTKAHDTSLVSVETDDVGVLFRYLDGFFLYGFFLAFDEEDHQRWFEPEVRDTTERDFGWLRELWKRSLVAQNSDTVVAKLFSLGTRLPAFLEAFPDARILYMARDPVATIPSGMSLVSGVLDNAFGFSKLPEDVRKRWLERLYSGLVELQRRFHADYTSGRLPHDQVYIVRYDRMMTDFEGLMDEIHTFLGVVPTDAQRKAIAEQGEQQRSYKSGHAYDLARFGLDDARIRRDCAFYYETFLSDPVPVRAQEQPATRA